jgi:stage V sporulation protein B
VADAPIGIDLDPVDAHGHQRLGNRQLLIARAWFFVSGYVVAVILARRLGPAGYGIYGVVMSLLYWLEMLTNAGVPTATSKFIADGRHALADVERSARALLIGVALVLLVAAWATAPLFAAFLRISEGTLLLRVAILDLPFAALYAFYDGFFSGQRRFGRIAVGQIVLATAKVVGVVLLIRLGLTVETVLVANVIATATACVVLGAGQTSTGIGPSRSTVASLALLAAPIALYLVAGQVLLNLDLWSLKRMWRGDPGVVGQYVASGNLARTLSVIPSVQAGVLFASVAWAVAESDAKRAREHIHEATRFALIIAAGVLVILSSNAPELLSVLFSAEYAGGSRFLQLQLAGFALFAFCDAFAHVLMAVGREWWAAAVVAGTIPCVVVSNVVLIPRLGPIGAAVSLVVGMTVTTVVTGMLATRQFGSLVRGLTLLRVLLAAAATALASLAAAVHGPLVIVKAAALGVVYLSVLYLTREVTAADWGHLQPQASLPE